MNMLKQKEMNQTWHTLYLDLAFNHLISNLL